MSELSELIQRKRQALKEGGPAYKLLAAGESRFKRGSAYWDASGRRCGPREAVAWDLLGALWKAYDSIPSTDRRFVSKRVFDLCQSRYGHRMIGKLEYEQALEILKDLRA
jgi:hypothetical protein